MLKLYVAVHAALAGFTDDLTSRLTTRDERGQGTAEYALVLVVAAGIAFIVAKYFTSSGGTGLIEGLFSGIVGKLASGVGKFIK